METASDIEEQEYPDGLNDTKTTKTASIAINTEINKTTNYKCNGEYKTTHPDYIGSTVERMPATPTPPSSPPGKRKLLPELPLVNIVSKVHVDTDSSTSSSYSDSSGPPLPLNGIIHRRIKKSEMNMSGGIDFEDQHKLNLPGYSTPSLSTPQTPSLSSTNASTTPSSALLTSVSLASSTSATTPTTPQLLHSDLMKAQLLQWHDMPQYLQFNPYVLRGYRPLQTFKGCLLSLFYWHNETINILTHAIPIIYILAIVPGLMPWDKGYKFLSFCHIFGSVAPWCGSFVYHLFMNIEKGEKVYYTLLKLDMVGIWVSQSFGAMPLVTATTYCFTPILKWFIIISYCLLSFWGLYKALTASSPWQRRLCFALPFCMRSILTFFRIKGYVGGSHMALSHVYLQFEVDGVSILGGAIGAMRIPEKWFPGLVDYYLNSHNIMHVLVVVAVYSMHKATIKDFEWMSTQTCNTYVGNSTEEAHVEL